VLPPGTSGQKILDRLPGVSVQSNDAFGANEESQTISLRGFDKSRLGYTLDGIPLGDNSYGNYNGLSIARAIIAENLAGAELSQGIGRWAWPRPATWAAPSSISRWTRPPNSVAAPASPSATTPAPRLPARGHRRHQRLLGLRVRRAPGPGHVGRAVPEPDHPPVQRQGSVERRRPPFRCVRGDLARQPGQLRLPVQGHAARGLGYDWNIYAPDWDRAVAAAYCAPGTYNKARCKFSGGVNSIDDAYYQSRALRDDNLYSVDADLRLGEQGRLKLLAYHHDNRGQGHWWAPGQPSYPGTDRMLPISIRSTNYTINRDGLTAALSWTVGIHELEAGLWYEQNDHNVSRNFYYISGPFLDDLYLKNPDRLLFNQDFDIRTRQFYVQDRMRFLDQRLTVDVGIKSPNTRMRATAQPAWKPALPRAR
jgi:iron complex outermembrane receptor protein